MSVKDYMLEWLNEHPEKYEKYMGMIYGGFVASVYAKHGIKDKPMRHSGTMDQFLCAIGRDIVGVAKKLQHWKKHGFAELNDMAGIDVDSYTALVTSKSYYTKQPVECAMQAFKQETGQENSNSAMTRVAACCIKKNWQKTTVNLTILTHVSSLCIYAGWILNYVCRSLMNGHIPSFHQIINRKLVFVRKRAKEFNDYQKIYYEKDPKTLLESLELNGEDRHYVLKTLGCVFYALLRINDDFFEVLSDVKKQGGSVLYNLTVVGMVLGSHLGYKKIQLDNLDNKRWLDLYIIQRLENDQ